jgi:SAM-dependent methyltransferase
LEVQTLPGGPLLDLLTAFSRRSRARRMARCVELLGIGPQTRVLDVGGTMEIWRLAPVAPRLIMLNEPRAGEETGGGAAVVFADGCALPFRDASFDVVFSNSVIEHVGDADAQARFAAEVCRVGRRCWVQTPNRRFFLETHLLTPFVHWLPRAWQARLLGWGTVWEWIVRPSPDRRQYYLDHYLTRIRLLTAADMARLFPRARILRERFLGWTKSLVAFTSATAGAGETRSHLDREA